MPVTHEQAKLRWEDGDLPVSTQFDDPYYARSDGLAETRHVYLAGNGLPGRWIAGGPFHIAELGFGTGLNFLATLDLWRRHCPDRTLNYTAFEMYPMAPDDLRRALGHWPELADLRGELLANWPASAMDLPGVHLDIVHGDARQGVPGWHGTADAWFLDGFAPSRNPELWEPSLMQAVHDHTAPGGTFATYTVAGAVRRALSAAGFTVEKRKGFGTKRDMAVGWRTGSIPCGLHAGTTSCGLHAGTTS